MLEAVVTEETSDDASDREREACKLMRCPCAFFPVGGRLTRTGGRLTFLLRGIWRSPDARTRYGMACTLTLTSLNPAVHHGLYV